MKTFRINFNTKARFSPSAACIGLFDGIHLGHAKLAQKALKLAKEGNMKSAVITFDPDPREVYLKDIKREHLLTDKMKYSMFEQMGFDRIYIIEFDEFMCNMSPEEFILYLNKLNIKELVCGFDFSFGRYGKGNCNTLLQNTDIQFNVTVIDSVDYEGRKISSSRIIKQLDKGRIDKVNALLGYEYKVHVNSDNTLYQHLPADGSYIGKVDGKPCEITIENGMITSPQYDGEMTLVFEKRI